MANTVLDLLPTSEIEKWKPGDHVLVIAGTGKCKTTWVKQVLWLYCKARGLSLFTLANRSMLRDDIKNDTDMPVMTYQLLEQQENHEAWKADVIVMDECHSLATDVLLDYRRDMMLRFFENKKTLIVGLTATPVKCVTELFDPDLVYEIPRDVSHIESVQTYHGVQHTPNILRAEMSKGGRVLCFVQSSKRGLEIHYEIADTAFVCSRNAKQWTKKIEAQKQFISKNRHWGQAQALIATKVMDVGVSIEDRAVTSVIVETDDYTVDLIQMIGRIRCRDGQRIRVFICIPSDQQYLRRHKDLTETLSFFEDYQANPKRFTYTGSRFPLILGDGQVNRMMYRYYKQLLQNTQDILTIGAKAVLLKQLCNIDITEYEDNPPSRPVTHTQRAKMTAELLKIVQPLVSKEFPARQELLEHFEGHVQVDRHLLGMPPARLTRKSVNELLEALCLPYRIDYRQYSKGEQRGKHYCIIVNPDENP